MDLSVKTKGFDAGRPIPKKHAYKGEGQNISPPLAWSGAPDNTNTYAIIVEDPDAPSPKNPRPNPWVHWVVYNIPADTTSIEEGDNGGGTEGRNDFGEKSYGGPMPPAGSGAHRYFFKVYALDTELSLDPGATKEELIDAMEGHVLAKGQIHGTYEKTK